MMRKVLLSALLLSSALCAGAEGSTAVNINTTTSAVSAQPLTPIQKGEALIQKLTQNQAVIDQTFTTENGWIGYVVRPAQSLRGAILYTDATGSYLFAGNLVNSDGQNLTQAYTEEYVNSKLATQAAALVGDLNWIQQGQDSAPHKAYIVLDPNCIYCHLLFQELQPVIEQGNLQVRWIMVGLIRPTSAGKSAQIFYTKSEDQLNILKKNETDFDSQAESGGADPLIENAQDVAVTSAFTKVKQNNAFFEKFGFEGTPVLLFKSDDGTPQLSPGFPRQEILPGLISRMGSRW